MRNFAASIVALAIGAIVLALSVGVRAQTRHRPPILDPAQNLVRVALRLTTDARFASIRVISDNPANPPNPANPTNASQSNAVVQAHGQRLTGPADLRTAVLENLMALSSNVEGSAATGEWRIVLLNVEPSTAMTWLMNVQPGHRLALDVINLNDEQQPRAVDHFEGATGDMFTTSGAQLRLSGPLPNPAPPAARLVLAHYYPWYTRASWTDPTLVDQPLSPYSTDNAADVLQDLQTAKRAGLDGVIVSFNDQGGSGGVADRAVRYVQQAAQQLSMQVSTQIETLAANTAGVEGAPPEPDVLVQWITSIVDRYASNPTYLRVDNRPVIFIYAWILAPDTTWRAVLDRVRASGRNPFIIADTIDPASLAVADGEYTYGATLFASEIPAYSTRGFVMSTRTYHLLGAANGLQRLATATVSPGYDDRALSARSVHRVVDRQNGLFYDSQWDTAAHSGADWIIVTSWNEWFENTQIEPSQRYGDYYRWQTDFWSITFKKSKRP